MGVIFNLYTALLDLVLLLVGTCVNTSTAASQCAHTVSAVQRYSSYYSAVRLYELVQACSNLLVHVLKDILGYYNKRKVGRYTLGLHVLRDILGYYNRRKVGRYTQSCTCRSTCSTIRIHVLGHTTAVGYSLNPVIKLRAVQPVHPKYLLE